MYNRVRENGAQCTVIFFFLVHARLMRRWLFPSGAHGKVDMAVAVAGYSFAWSVRDEQRACSACALCLPCRLHGQHDVNFVLRSGCHLQISLWFYFLIELGETIPLTQIF
jgi:hypothetical protein